MYQHLLAKNGFFIFSKANNRQIPWIQIANFANSLNIYLLNVLVETRNDLCRYKYGVRLDMYSSRLNAHFEQNKTIKISQRKNQIISKIMSNKEFYQ